MILSEILGDRADYYKIRMDAHIKNSREQIKLRTKHLELNQRIESLTKDLIKTKNKILSKSNFENRENTLQQIFIKKYYK